MLITFTNPLEIHRINKIISESKSVWGYDEEYLKAAIPLIQIDSNWISKNKAYSIYDDELVGFLGIEVSESSWHLEHLWITPSKMRSGLGKYAVQFMLSEAKTAGIKSIYLFPDPPVEGFYSKVGADFTGKHVPSRIHCGPLFNEMVFRI